MTLKQAFTMWACAPRNTVLAAKSRDAVQRVLMKKYNDMDLEVFTESFCRRIFSQSSETQEVKVKAASILVYLLQWGGDNGHCQRPTFTYEIASAMLEPSTEEPKVEEKPKEEPKEEETMEEQKRTRGKQPRKVCQLDPDTLQVVATFDSITAGCKAVGVKNLDRSIKKHQRAGGYYWAYPEDVEGFKPTAQLTTSRTITKTSPKPKPKVEVPVKNDITQFSDDELIAEMKRRGWKGNVTMTISIDL